MAKTWTPRGEEKIITSVTPLEDLCRALSISHDPCEVARMKTTSKRRGEERRTSERGGLQGNCGAALRYSGLKKVTPSFSATSIFHL